MLYGHNIMVFMLYGHNHVGPLFPSRVQVSSFTSFRLAYLQTHIAVDRPKVPLSINAKNSVDMPLIAKAQQYTDRHLVARLTTR